MALAAALRRSTNILRTSPFSSRPYSASAAAIDYDDYYHSYDDHYDHQVDGEGSEPLRGVQWVIIGEPGARKHVYAEWLSKLLDVPHISLGSLVRQELSPHSSLYKQIENAVNQGKLVPEDVIFSLLSKKLEEGHSRGETGFILDGIPRTIMQAEILDQVVDIDLVLNFKCADGHPMKSGLENGLNFPSKGSWIRSLSEDTARMEKLRTYAEQSKPLEDYYRKQKKLLDFQVAGAFGENCRGLLSVLQLQHMNPSIQKLTA